MLRLMSWQRIDTAKPSDGEILIWDGIWVHTARFINGEWMGTSGGEPFFEDDRSAGEYRPGRLYLFPTHWMPKPDPPP